jgi:hypothetical protein
MSFVDDIVKNIYNLSANSTTVGQSVGGKELYVRFSIEGRVEAQENDSFPNTGGSIGEFPISMILSEPESA